MSVRGKSAIFAAGAFLAAYLAANDSIADNVIPLSALQEAQSGVPPPGYAGVYIIRPSSLAGSLGGYYLTFDGGHWGFLDNGEYLWEPVLAGPHAIRISDFSSTNTPFTAEAGKTYCFEIAYSPIHLFSPYSIDAVTEEEGREEIRELTLNPDHWRMRKIVASWPLIREGMTADEVAPLLPDPIDSEIIGVDSGLQVVQVAPRLGAIVNQPTVLTVGSHTLSYIMVFSDGVLKAKVHAPEWPRPPGT